MFRAKFSQKERFMAHNLMLLTCILIAGNVKLSLILLCYLKYKGNSIGTRTKISLMSTGKLP